MPVPSSFDYAVVRVVPRVERGEFINAGVIVFCLERRFLEARVEVDEARLRALWPEIDIELVRKHLEAIPRIAAGDVSAGPIARLSQRERFHWLVSPRSTIIQVSPVHSGLCDVPGQAMEQLSQRLLAT
ncbi:MAG: hypothetical protein BGO25_04940 [Acidobacteriales bacterium 59-55]|nr:DUF3037 domain-containing protein [Terriglobales bacterium]ODU55772.1 MAG: hypothetical protein ABT04_00205 [Granulicella sp. SCN 62-9]OJV44443.1 MAG: hypothetical protein BGO25_04940 [Acidobacteriales bacterium 59-55]